MKKIFLTILILISGSQISGAEIISLGGACNVARASRQNGLRSAAYPFDWMITPLHSLRQAFEDDFLQIGHSMHLSEDEKSAVDIYGLIYIHDFPTVRYPDVPVDGEIMPVHRLAENWENAIPVVQAKFHRRLARMRQFLEEGIPVALVRYQDMNRADAEEWIDLLQRKFPRACLILAVLGSTSEFQIPWDIPHVHNFYLEEKEVRAWDGPVWGAILQKIAKLELTGWKTSAKGYVLTAPIYNPGLFSVFNTVLGALDAYDRGKISGLKVDFEEMGWYFDPAHGKNWWNYYFEPILLGEINESGLEHRFPTYQKIEFAYTSQFVMSKERAYQLIQKYIRILPHIDQQVQKFCEIHFTDHFVIGLHYRGTDKGSEAEPVGYDQAISALESVLADHREQAVKIFLATDDAVFAKMLQQQYPDKVIMQEALRSNNREGVHTRKDLDAYRKGEEAVIDCLLLSKCSFLIKMASNLSDCSLQFNPKLPSIRLNKSYSE